MKCLGRTKKLQRCKREKFPFCHQHRFQIIIWLIGIGSAFIYVADMFTSYEYFEKKIKNLTFSRPDKNPTTFKDSLKNKDAFIVWVQNQVGKTN